jgi:DNA-binding SARP family transcriptional activator
MCGKQLAEGTNVGLLGNLVVEGRRGVIDLGPPRQQAVFAALAMHANERLLTSRIITMVWGPEGPTFAANLVHKYMSGLRRAIAVLPEEDRVTIDSTRHGYRLTARADQVDIALFHQLVAQGRRLSQSSPDEAALVFQRALDLWRGPLLSELCGGVFEEKRTVLESLRLSVIEECAAASVAAGRYQHAMGLLQGAVHEYPLEEHLARLLIISLYHSGRTAEAVRAYQRLQSTLLSELGVHPRPELDEMYQAIRRHDVALVR